MLNDSQLHELSQRCCEETAKFRQGKQYDTQYAYELFRLAFKERDERAWAFIYEHYREQVGSWIKRNPKFIHCDEEIDYFVNRTFARIWHAIKPERFTQFPNLAQILRYLQMCSDSAIQDHKILLNMVTHELHSDVQGKVHQMDTQIEQQELWDLVQTHIRNEQEQVFVHAYFIWGLKPKQICREFPNLFKNPKVINAVKTAFLARLRRNLYQFDWQFNWTQTQSYPGTGKQFLHARTQTYRGGPPAFHIRESMHCTHKQPE